MKVIEPIKLACEFLNLDDYLAEIEEIEKDLLIEAGEHPLCLADVDMAALSMIQCKLFSMLTFANTACEETAADYLPLKRCEEIYSNESCQILLSDFSMPVRGVIKVENNEYVCTFNDFATFIKVGMPNHKYLITYAYYPTACMNFVSELEVVQTLSARVLAYKIASELCLSKMLYDESVMWDKRFVESISQLKNKLYERRVQPFPLY